MDESGKDDTKPQDERFQTLDPEIAKYAAQKLSLIQDEIESTS